MTKIVKQFLEGDIKTLTGDAAHELVTQIQIKSLQAPIGNIALIAAIEDHTLLGQKETMDRIDQAFSPKN